MLNEKDKEKIEAVLEKHQDEPGPLISILQEVQNIFGYLPEDALSYISQKLKISK